MPSGACGKKIGVFPGTAPSHMLGAFFKKHGVDPVTVSMVQLPPQAQISSLESGAVDALFSYEPVTTTAFVHGGYRPLFGSVYADLLNPCPSRVSVISREFERDHPQSAAAAERTSRREWITWRHTRKFRARCCPSTPSCRRRSPRGSMSPT